MNEEIKKYLEKEIPKSYYIREKVNPQDIIIDNSRDELLTDFGKATLKDRYLLNGESYQEMFVRVSTVFADNHAHAQRLYDYMSQLWFMPSTPILSGAGKEKAMPISCFLNSVTDNMEGIVDNYVENVWLSVLGGGIGSNWQNVRSIGEKVGINGKTSGIIPFIGVQDRLSLAISQGNLRSGSAAVFIHINHPEIQEFLEIRKPSGDFNRKAINLHHGVCITDEFMEAVEKDLQFALRSPKTNQVIKYVNARDLWQKILEIRISTGEPYLIFIDSVNNEIAEHHKKLGLTVNSSNLCSEIMLPNGIDHLGNDRTSVCCLSSVNLEKYYDFKDNDLFLEDILRFLDNVLQFFIEKAPDAMNKARYSALRERSIGLGCMGLDSLFQSRMIPFESVTAKILNKKIFKDMREQADKVSKKLAIERGSCLDASESGYEERFSYKLAIAPTASISIICGGTSPGIEKIYANIFTHKTLSGNFSVRNKYLEKILEEKGINNQIVWNKILANEGSAQDIEELSPLEKDVVKTAFEVDPRWVLELAEDRSPYICQSTSLNLFLPSTINKYNLHMIHYSCWKKKIKSLYYLRSKSIQRAAFIDGSKIEQEKEETIKYMECLSCQ